MFRITARDICHVWRSAAQYSKTFRRLDPNERLDGLTK